jgi:hypothetical protein
MTLYPIEVKKTANPNIQDCKNFKALSNFKKEVGSDVIVCLYERTMSMPKENVVIVPAW